MNAIDFLDKYSSRMKQTVFNTVNRTFVETPKKLTEEIAEELFNFNFKVVEVVERHKGNGCVVLELTNDIDALKRLLHYEYPDIYNF